MTKFLTAKSRSWLSMVLIVCALLIAVSMAPFHMKVPPSPWVKDFFGVLQFVIIFIIAGLALYLGYVQPTAWDLIQATKQRLGEEKKTIQAWSNIEIRHPSFQEMGWKDKMLYTLSMIVGIFACLYGIADFFGAFPELKMPDVEGKIITVPRWVTGCIALSVGVASFSIVSLLRIKLVDRCDKFLQKLVKDIENDKIKPE